MGRFLLPGSITIRSGLTTAYQLLPLTLCQAQTVMKEKTQAQQITWQIIWSRGEKHNSNTRLAHCFPAFASSKPKGSWGQTQGPVQPSVHGLGEQGHRQSCCLPPIPAKLLPSPGTSCGDNEPNWSKLLEHKSTLWKGKYSWQVRHKVWMAHSLRYHTIIPNNDIPQNCISTFSMKYILLSLPP